MTVQLADLALALRRDQVIADDGQLYDTVQAAENAASSFIWLPPATFNESVTVDTAGLVVMGSGRDTLIDGGTSGDAIDVTVDDVVILNLSVQTTAGQGNSFDGVNTRGGAGSIIERVWVRDSDRLGIAVGDNSIVRSCVVESSDVTGIIGGTQTDKCIITGCIVTSASTDASGGGIFVISDSIAAYNTVRNSGNHGIQFGTGSDDGIAIGNRIIGSSGNGVHVPGSATDNIVANNNITGSTGSDISDSGTNTLIDANVPSVVLTVDDFESGNITSVTAPWNNWAGDTGSFSSQTGTVLAGSRSGELAATNEIVDVRTDRNDKSNSITTFEYLTQIDNQTGNAGDRAINALSDGTSDFASIQFQGDGDITVGGSDTGVNWAANTEYRVVFKNIDFDGETYAVDIIRTSDSTTIVSETGVAFTNSVTGVGRFRFQNDANGAGASINMYIDNIQTTR